MNVSLYSKSYNEIIDRMKGAYNRGEKEEMIELASQAAEIARKILASPGVASSVLEFYRRELKTLAGIVSGNKVRVRNDAAKTENRPEEKAEEPQPEVPEVSLDEAMAKLNEQVGLQGVKERVNAVMSQLRLYKEREKRGLPVPPINYHMVFTGNPGTGKTTVARLIAQMYRALGVVKKGHLVEVFRRDLVAEYEGQTAVKTAKVIESAMGGILFIDEAYDLVRKGGNDPFGMEAVNTLLPLMENKRSEFVVILAGYSDEMSQFLEANPGFHSRFNTIIDFEDYSEEDLLKIFMINCKKSGYNLTQEAGAALMSLLDEVYANRTDHFANGRQMRNILEDMICAQSIRLSEKGRSLDELSNEDLTTMDASDVPTDYKKYIG